ncbi:hypothetical protein ABEB36_011976 [Hypothenemus hampei]
MFAVMQKSSETMEMVLQVSDVKNAVKSYQMSKKYVKRLVKITLLNILKRRVDIPETEFEKRDLEGVEYFVFKRKSQNRFIKIYHSAGTGIIDAIEKDYLKEMKLYFIQKTTRKILETYQMKIRYNKDESKASKTAASAQKDTAEFIQTINMLPGTQLVGDDIEFFIELVYNDGTPGQYEPPNFQTSMESICPQLTFNDSVKLGSISTGFHKITAFGKGDNFVITRFSTPIEVDEYGDEGENMENKLAELGKEEKSRSPYGNFIEGVERKCSNNKLALKENNFSSEEFKTINSSISNEYVSGMDWPEDKVNCVCGWNLPKTYNNCKCSKCGNRVHIICHGYLSPLFVKPEYFQCENCKPTQKNSVLAAKIR